MTSLNDAYEAKVIAMLNTQLSNGIKDFGKIVDYIKITENMSIRFVFVTDTGRKIDSGSAMRFMQAYRRKLANAPAIVFPDGADSVIRKRVMRVRRSGMHSVTGASITNIARVATTGVIQLTVDEAEYNKMKKDGSLTISGLTTATFNSSTTDISSLNGTFDITSATRAGTSNSYIIELAGSSSGTTAIGTVTPSDGTVPTGVLTGALATGLAAKTGLDITSVPRAQASLTRIRNSIDKLAQDRASLGAVQSRLNFTNEQLTVTKENLSAAISRIADVDVAEEATSYARYQILVQSGTSMLAQANKMPQSALQLLQG
jgi:flagellin-like hook-associated protein FlgL